MDRQDPPLLLFVEDDDLVRQMVSGKLRAEGFAVVSCNGADGETPGRKTPLEGLAGRQPAVALVDWHLERGEAAELVRTLNEALPETPVLILSADGREVVMDRGARSGAWRWLKKTESETSLMQAINEAVEEHRRRCEATALDPFQETQRLAILSEVRWFGSVKTAADNLGLPVDSVCRRFEDQDPAA